MSDRRIAFFTATRAEWGLLVHTLRALRSHAGVETQLVVSGAHLSPAHGETWRQIEADGFGIDARCDMLLSSDSPLGAATSMGLCTMKVADALDRLRPDLFVVLGDRYEALAAAQAAFVMGVPIAHLCGGEVTEGVLDDALRHAVTKLSALHFVAADAYRDRVLQLGEDPARVLVVGSPGLDHFAALPLLSKERLEADLGFPLTSPSMLVTFHPPTLGDASPEAATAELVRALEAFPDAQILMTEPNADPGGQAVRRVLHAFAERHPGRVRLVASLGQVRYASALRAVDVVVGNSSSGLIEAPAAGVPTVNIGDRQKGRLRGASVIDVPESAEAIASALREALTPGARARAASTPNPYGIPGAGARIAAVLAAHPLEGLRRKAFFDL